MATDYTWTLNGVDLDTATGHLASATVWRPPISVRRSATVIPGRHGSIDVGLPTFEEPIVPISVRTVQTSQAALEAAVNSLVTLLTQPTLTLGRTSGGVTASARARLVSVDTDHDFLVGVTAAPVAQLAIPGVFFRGTLQTSDDFAFNADLLNQEVATLSGSTAPITDVVIRVTGPCSSVTITDPATATGLSWTGTLAAGQYLFLCPAPLSARISADPAAFTAGGTSVLSGVDWPATGRLQLWPVVQTATTRKVLLSATGTGRSAATKLAVRGRGSYL